MKKLLFFLLLVMLFSCRKADDNLLISSGFVCGWGSGEDSLVISSSEIKYVYYIPQKSSIPQIRGTRAITKSEWNEIEDALNTDKFIKLDYNTCNLCVDGCDEWISMRGDDVNHQIRFNKDQKIESIAKLQDIIARFKAEFH